MLLQEQGEESLLTVTGAAEETGSSEVEVGVPENIGADDLLVLVMSVSLKPLHDPESRWHQHYNFLFPR